MGQSFWDLGMAPGLRMQIKTTIELPAMQRRIQKAYRYAMDDAALELADYLQRHSPRGVSPVGESLAGNWEVQASRKVRGQLYAQAFIRNYAEASLPRILGRAPGKFPPFAKGTPLAKWAESKGIPPFVVAKSIAKKGTKRWRTKRNILEVDPVNPNFQRSPLMARIFVPALKKSLDKVRL